MNSETEMFSAQWDFLQVAELFADLEQGAVVQHVQVRSVPVAAGENTRPADRSITLREAQELLEKGLAKAIQIRYTFEGEQWCDTLMPSEESVQIVRTRNNDTLA